MFRFGRACVVLLAAVIAGLPSCKESNTAATPTPSATPTPAPVRIVWSTFSFDQFRPGIPVQAVLPIPQTAILDVTVDWTFPDSWITIHLANRACDATEFYAGTCPFLASDDTRSPKPKTLTTGVLQPATYYLYLYNVPKDRVTDGTHNVEAAAVVLGLTVGVSGSGLPQPVTANPVALRP
jgi:hypothetical protein